MALALDIEQKRSAQRCTLGAYGQSQWAKSRAPGRIWRPGGV